MDKQTNKESEEPHLTGYLLEAFKIAQNHPHYKELPSLHGAVLVKGGNIISRGYNKPKRNVFIDIHAYHEGCNIHSELDCVLKARRKMNLRGCKMYVARMRKDTKRPAMSKPCPMCQRVLKHYGIKRVYFTACESSVSSLRV